MKKIFFLTVFYIILFNAFTFTSAQEKAEYTKFYYPNGQVSSEGLMINGKPDGFWKTYHVSGVIKSEGLRLNFELDSAWNFYNQVGELIEIINYKYGKRNGYAIGYSYEKSPSGVIIRKELYLNDVKQGKAYYYHLTGNLKEEVSYSDGKRQGPAKEYDENGNLIMIMEYHNNYLISRERINRTDAQGNKQGPWKYYHDNGILFKEMNYTDNLLDGLYREYANSGTLILSLRYDKGKLFEESDKTLNNNIEIDVRREFTDDGKLKFTGSFRNNKPLGIHRFYNNEGQIVNSEIFNEEGEVTAQGIVDETGNRNGAWKDLYPDGKLKAEGTYNNNLRSGKWVFYYNNGKKEQEGNYLRGNLDGTWRWYHSNGELWREEMYFNGREDGESIEYNADGKIVAKGSYINGEKEGLWRFDVGDHSEEGNYQSGLENEIWKHYYLDGTIKFIGEFRQGLPEGKHKYYYPDGSLMEERFYSRGLKEKNWKKYDESGNLYITITYRRDEETRINGEKISLPKSSVTRIR